MSETARSGQNAFGATETVQPIEDRGEIWQTIVATGRRDMDPDDLRSPSRTSILAARIGAVPTDSRCVEPAERRRST